MQPNTAEYVAFLNDPLTLRLAPCTAVSNGVLLWIHLYVILIQFTVFSIGSDVGVCHYNYLQLWFSSIVIHGLMNIYSVWTDCFFSTSNSRWHWSGLNHLTGYWFPQSSSVSFIVIMVTRMQQLGVRASECRLIYLLIDMASVPMM